MKAMILAAGLGTRLRPLTDDRPKALVEVGGRTLLEIALTRLKSFGVSEVVVNAHHFAGMVIAYLKAKEDFGMRIEVSREEELLDTGGGLKRAAGFLCDGSDEPIVVHNVDVISAIDLRGMAGQHRERGALATLAVQERRTSRYLLFDGEGRLCGRQAGGDGQAEMVRATAETERLAFCGIHVISPRLFGKMSEEGAFSIIAAYLRLAAEGEAIVAYRADGAYWRDLGRVESLRQAEEDLASGEYRLS